MKYDFSNNTIETERLLLREYTLDDVDKVVEYCNDPDMSRYMLHIPYPYKREDAINWINSHREYIEKDRLFNYAITDKDTGELLGTVSLSHNKENRNGEIGYWIGKKYWNKGYATEACKAIIQYAFEVKEYPVEIPDNMGKIEFVATKVEARGKEVAYRLLQHIIQDTGYDAYVLEVASNNVKAIKLYDRLGFKEIKRVPQKHAKQSGFEHLIYMQLNK